MKTKEKDEELTYNDAPVNINGLTREDLNWLRGFEPRDIKGNVYNN